MRDQINALIDQQRTVILLNKIAAAEQLAELQREAISSLVDVLENILFELDQPKGHEDESDLERDMLKARTVLKSVRGDA